MRFITKQAEHYEISELIHGLVYRYKSLPGFKGKEHVVIECRSSSGGANFNIITIIEIIVEVH
jgi:hypothetical protein